MPSPKLRVIFQPKSEIQTFFSPKIRWSPKKKKKVFTEIESEFSAGFVKFGLVGGDASRNGAELFEIEADFSAKIVTFRLVGGMHPPHPPPKSATASNMQRNQHVLSHQKIQQKIFFVFSTKKSNFCHYFCSFFLFCH